MKKKHTLIVGGTRGIGRALVKTLAEQGHAVSVIGKRSPLKSDKNIPNVSYWILDLLDKDSLLRALTEIINQNGKLNNLIFFQRYSGEGDDWTGEIEVSLTATNDIIELLADKFDDANGNSIIIISSIASHF